MRQEAGRRSGEATEDSERLLRESDTFFWEPLREGPSQFIDIQGFDPLTTGMSQRLRQPCLSSLCWAKKPGGSPAVQAASAQLSWWTNQSNGTMSHSCGHILPFFLSFFSFFDFPSCCFTMGTARESAFCLLTMPGVSRTSPYMYSAKKSVCGHWWLPLYRHLAAGIFLQRRGLRSLKPFPLCAPATTNPALFIHSYLLEAATGGQLL